MGQSAAEVRANSSLSACGAQAVVVFQLYKFYKFFPILPLFPHFPHFPICPIFLIFPISSYWLSKLSPFSIFFRRPKNVKKNTSTIFLDFRPGIESGRKKVCFPGADSLATLKSKIVAVSFFYIAYQHRSSGALYIDVLIDIVVVVYSTYPGYSFDCSKLFNRVEQITKQQSVAVSGKQWLSDDHHLIIT